MPAISRIRLCNVIYENGGKRYNDQLFHLDGQNSAILLENGGGKTVFIQTVIQSIIPHLNMADRKIKDTLYLDQGPAHVAIEWILNEQPRRYGITCVSLFQESGQLNSLKYTYEYASDDDHTIEKLPFKIDVTNGSRPATRGEISEYYQRMSKTNPYAQVFSTIQEYGKFLETQFKIIPSEWRKVAVINSGEGNVDEYFNRCKTTEQLLNNLLIPVVEEAIEDENSVEFAKTFEKQRDHFKKNRILHDKIEQSKGIKVEIDQYVDVYKRYDAQLQKAKVIKGKAKTVTDIVEETMEDTREKMTLNDAEKGVYKKDEAFYEQQKISYQIMIAANKLEHKMKDIDVLETKLEHLNEKRNQSASRRQNIQLTKVKRSIRELESEIRRLEIELEDEDKELPLGDIQVKLQENSANIKGHFSYELELIKLEKEKRMDQIKKLQKELDQQRESIDLIKTKELAAKEKVIKTEATIDLNKKMMDDIYDNLFESQIGASVDEYVTVWNDEAKLKDSSIQKIKSQRMDLKSTMDSFGKDQENLLENLKSKQKDLKDTGEVLETITLKSDELIKTLNHEGIRVSQKELIYTKEDSIKTLLQEKEQFYQDKKQSLLMDELDLMTKNLLNDVMHPSILKVAGKIKEQVDYLSLGQDYLYQLVDSSSQSPQALLESYPFFAMTLVTNRANKEKVLNLLDTYMQELLVPTFVLTIEEVSNIIKADELEENLFMDSVAIPSIWKESLSSGYLENHNAATKESLRLVTEERQRIEQNWASVLNLKSEISSFFTKYPYDVYLIHTNNQVTLHKEILDLKADTETIEIEIAGLKNQYDELEQVILYEEEQLKSVKANIIQGQKHEEIYSHYLTLREEEELQRSLISQLIYERKDLEFKCDSLMKDITKLQESIKEFIFDERKILENPLYKEVEEVLAICANIDILTLVNQRDSLKKKLAGLSVSRDTIMLRIQEQTKLYQHYIEQLKRLEKEAEFKVESIDVFYDHEEDELFDTIVTLKKEIKEFENELRKEEKAKWALETEKNLLVKDLRSKGLEVYEFDCDLQYIPTRLKIFEGTLRDKYRKIEKEEKELSQQVGHLTNLLTELKIKDGNYNFLSGEGVALSRKEKEKTEENLKGFVFDLFKELSESGLALKNIYDEVMKSKTKVIDYCRDHVDDFRLKEAITNGLMEKDNYHELLIYQERMTDIINKTIQLANDDKRESDTELLTFLNHLLTYVKTIIHELDHLQKKTMIELEEGNKQIFVFDIPEYNEEGAKEGLRLYIDQMIELFEEEEERDEEHLRALIEERLSIKNLIPVVLAHLPIKVKCRKVTNDLKINKAPMSWEFSNKWSGGEKWSKNMTLFLGILNYLAEKKQHLSPNQKRNRTVILDNPFGKASSKHVLDPVFFIAERLGFQIIALTAHAEGQFISDYFPVVYSLRLRETGQVNKLLMTSERTLNYTYLKEKAPASIERLQEAQQIDLFQL